MSPQTWPAAAVTVLVFTRTCSRTWTQRWRWSSVLWCLKLEKQLEAQMFRVHARPLQTWMGIKRFNPLHFPNFTGLSGSDYDHDFAVGCDSNLLHSHRWFFHNVSLQEKCSLGPSVSGGVVILRFDHQENCLQSFLFFFRPVTVFSGNAKRRTVPEICKSNLVVSWWRSDVILFPASGLDVNILQVKSKPWQTLCRVGVRRSKSGVKVRSVIFHELFISII